MIHGLTVGPQLFQNNPHAVYAFMLGMLVTNIIMFFLGHYGARRVFVNVVKVPNNILGPVVVVLSVIGSFAIRNSISDVIIMLAFGVIGYVMEKYGYPTAPVVLTLILGPLAGGKPIQDDFHGRRKHTASLHTPDFHCIYANHDRLLGSVP